MSGDALKKIQEFISESNRLFNQGLLEQALGQTEKAYSLAINFENCSEITKKKIEFNLATLYTCLNNLKLAKAYLDRVKGTSVTFIRKRDVASLYAKLGSNLNDQDKIKDKIECYQSAAEYFAKSKDWLDYCQVELIHAKLLNENQEFDKGCRIAEKIQMACLSLRDQAQLAKIFCDLATIFAKDASNPINVKHAKRLLDRSLKIILKQNDVKLEICLYQNLAAVSNQLENYDKSLKYIELALDKLKSMSKPEYFITSDLKFNEGYAKAKLNQTSDAIESFIQSHEYATKTTQKNIWESFEAVGVLYAQSGRLDLAFENYEKAITYFKNYYENNSNYPKNLIAEKRLFAKQKLIKNKNNEINKVEIESKESSRTNESGNYSRGISSSNPTINSRARSNDEQNSIKIMNPTPPESGRRILPNDIGSNENISSSEKTDDDDESDDSEEDENETDTTNNRSSRQNVKEHLKNGNLHLDLTEIKNKKVPLQNNKNGRDQSYTNTEPSSSFENLNHSKQESEVLSNNSRRQEESETDIEIKKYSSNDDTKSRISSSKNGNNSRRSSNSTNQNKLLLTGETTDSDNFIKEEYRKIMEKQVELENEDENNDDDDDDDDDDDSVDNNDKSQLSNADDLTNEEIIESRKEHVEIIKNVRKLSKNIDETNSDINSLNEPNTSSALQMGTKSYKSFNRGYEEDHPEEQVDQKQKNKKKMRESSKICVIS